jgi:hypothetical protein
MGQCSQTKRKQWDMPREGGYFLLSGSTQEPDCGLAGEDWSSSVRLRRVVEGDSRCTYAREVVRQKDRGESAAQVGSAVGSKMASRSGQSLAVLERGRCDTTALGVREADVDEGVVSHSEWERTGGCRRGN